MTQFAIALVTFVKIYTTSESYRKGIYEPPLLLYAPLCA